MAKPRPPLPPGPYLVVGLARSGQAAARLLAGRGERVVGADDAAPAGAAGLREAGVEVHLDGTPLELLDGLGCIVKSPGVPREAPVIAAAHERSLPVIGELELAWRLLPNRFCAVTGTNGKTTVTELIGHVLDEAGIDARVAGNVGTPLASLVGETPAGSLIACECSSFQLEDSDAFAPECAVFLNVSPDHLDRHGTFADYVAAKLRIFANQDAGDVAVAAGDEPALAGRRIGGSARRVDPADVPDELLSGLRLLGPHNRANARAAAAACLALGADPGAVRDGIAGFEPLAHRLEPVRERAGVLYVNDSKATNVEAAGAALRSFPGGVRAILGGSLKGGGFESLAEAVAERCVACYLIGDAAGRLEGDLEPAWAAGVVRRRCAGLAEAVAAAAADAAEGEVVLLAPACASFDAYRDFEERGEHFRALVGELP